MRARSERRKEKDKVKGKANISQANQSLISKFLEQLQAEELSEARIQKYRIYLNQYSALLGKSFNDATREDIVKVVNKILSRKTKQGRELSEWTRRDYKVVLKRFYKWLNGGETYPREVSWIKTTMKDYGRKLPKDLLTKEEIDRMIDAANNPRDKALISVLYESGCRIGELLSLKIKDVRFDDYGAILLVSGKTGDRRVRIIESASYLLSWINAHPLKNNPEASLWVGTRNFLAKKKEEYKATGYRAITKLIKRIGERAGISKRVNPHNFRHSRATHLANKLTEAQMKEFFGWVQASKMASIYVHLSGRDVDDALLKAYGLKVKEEENEEVKTLIKCSRCNELNDPDAWYCTKCWLPLNAKATIKLEEKRGVYKIIIDKLIEKLLQDPKIKKTIFEKLKEI
jgi:site-specific recombinase XerD